MAFVNTLRYTEITDEMNGSYYILFFAIFNLYFLPETRTRFFLPGIVRGPREHTAGSLTKSIQPENLSPICKLTM